MTNFISKFKLDLLLIFLIFLTSPLFFYKLGDSSLVSWDEAWYGGIARNILQSGNIFHLQFNDKYYFDHPPFGFSLIAGSQKIFGINEFGTRFTPALCGLLTLVVVYLLGKQLFSRSVGFLSALSLLSAPWF